MRGRSEARRQERGGGGRSERARPGLLSLSPSKRRFLSSFLSLSSLCLLAMLLLLRFKVKKHLSVSYFLALRNRERERERALD